jgi:hypothetical protein
VDAEAAEAGAVGKAAAEAAREERDGDDAVVGALRVVEHAFMPVSFQERRKPGSARSCLMACSPW